MYYIRRFSVRPYDAALASTLENDYGIPCEVITHHETQEKTCFVFQGKAAGVPVGNIV